MIFDSLYPEQAIRQMAGVPPSKIVVSADKSAGRQLSTCTRKVTTFVSCKRKLTLLLVALKITRHLLPGEFFLSLCPARSKSSNGHLKALLA